MYGRGFINDDFAGGVVGHTGFSWLGGILSLIIVGLVIAATVIAIILLIGAARDRGAEVTGGRLAAFWFVGVCLTPIMLALYVLTLKPTRDYTTAPAYFPPEQTGTPARHANPSAGNINVDPTEPMPGSERPTQPIEAVAAVEVNDEALRRNAS